MPNPSFLDVLIATVRSRKFLTAIADLIVTLLAVYSRVDPAVIAAINIVFGAVIAGIAIEDAAMKRAAIMSVYAESVKPCDDANAQGTAGAVERLDRYTGASK